MDEFSERMLAACTEIGSRHRGFRVLVVTHGWGLDVVTRHINGLPRNAVLHVKPRNGESVWCDVSDRAS
jgi:probable phosphoglycerate mutase